ncbi:MAG: FitA-like ribbon-helix-helix domain-containing protein [Myxococcales bacterium]
MIQIRNVSDEVHRTLKARAAQAGMSLSDFLRREVEAVARRRPLEEIYQRASRRSSAEAVRSERESRR